MTLDQQVVSLDLAKQLKEAGYPQRIDENGRHPLSTFFYWQEFCLKRTDICEWFLMWNSKREKDGRSWYAGRVIAAPTVAELGEELPQIITSNRIGDGWLIIEKYQGGSDHAVIWKIRYEMHGEIAVEKQGYSEADARARMWLYLKKENLL